MPSDTLDDIELRSVQYQTPCIRTLNRPDNENVEEAIVETDRGTLLVAIQGDRRKPAILTYHDIGLNCEYKVANSLPKFFPPTRAINPDAVFAPPLPFQILL